ncbi:MAG: CoA-binding protein [Acidobacteria bacterium]|jgi:predicted CoA-binding protein|nr:CoA-binding protein [Acidobacteriota bacterium]
MKFENPETIKKILETCKTIAVVGLSSNPLRPSNGVANFMQKKDYKIVPVNPNESMVLGEKAYMNLSAVTEKIDLVDIFRRSEDAGAVVDEAIEIGAKAVWLQEGVIDEAAAKRAEKAGLLVVMDRCWLKDFIKYGG